MDTERAHGRRTATGSTHERVCSRTGGRSQHPVFLEIDRTNRKHSRGLNVEDYVED